VIKTSFGRFKENTEVKQHEIKEFLRPLSEKNAIFNVFRDAVVTM
jgi:hypothetical protein